MPTHLIPFVRSCAILFGLALVLSPGLIPAQEVATEATPHSLPDSETHIYRAGQPEPMRLFVFKPKDWKAQDRRPALIFFFGGGWSKGTPEKSAGWAKHFAKLGMVGIAPDYRTRNRFDTTPLQSVADGRAALRWVQDHATELGVDASKIVVGGNSAGGHVALWTAISQTPPGSDLQESPVKKPAALILLSTVSDTSSLSGYTPYRFGTNANALSPVNRLDAKMPPMLMFHGDADKTVPCRQALSLRDKLLSSSNVCELVTVPGGDHGFTSQLPEWKNKTQDRIRLFLIRQGLLADAPPQ
jgi:acetyl esterase